MSIPDSTLQKVLTTSSDLSKASLATKILISRLRLEISGQPAKLSSAIAELRAFFAKHPFAQKDLQAL